MIGNVEGLGLLFGFEVVKDRQTKEPFESKLQVSSRLEDACMKHGLAIYPRTGTVDGVLGNMMQLAPPLIITEAEMDELLRIVDEAIGDVEDQLGITHR